MTYDKNSIVFEPLPTAHNFFDRTKTEINHLKILGYAGKSVTQEPKTQWFVECHCGNIFVAIGSNLGNGNTKSCGCIPAENRRHISVTHRMSKTRTYRIWCGMKTRCTNPNNPNYQRYGKRGITICERWMHSFANFLEDMGHCPSNKHSIERKDNDGNYEPDNCYWEPDRCVQSNNTRRNHRITYQNRTQTLSQWAREKGLTPTFLGGRIRKGWSFEDAISTPKLTPAECARLSKRPYRITSLP